VSSKREAVRPLKVTAADTVGATVAASDKPTHYFQTDRSYWGVLYSEGQGAIDVADLRYDEQNRQYYVSIAYPILQESTGRFVGAVTALVDVSPLFAQLNREQIGRTGRLSLVRDDGTVIEAPGVAPSFKDALGGILGDPRLSGKPAGSRNRIPFSPGFPEASPISSDSPIPG
jgi:hypothetical protein